VAANLSCSGCCPRFGTKASDDWRKAFIESDFPLVLPGGADTTGVDWPSSLCGAPVMAHRSANWTINIPQEIAALVMALPRRQMKQLPLGNSMHANLLPAQLYRAGLL
jgi:hypothetical protein